jgi:D-alanyl-D-alanine carboxypeptidase/D-alanyl-D-alanine-endopeptidase (penicillin-binding protein 4)
VVLCFALPEMVLASAELPVGVRSVLNYRNVPDSTLSIYIESIDSGQEVLAWNDKQARNPASVEKMLTTLVALDTLGPAYRWKTEIYALGEIQDSELQGDLLLKGFGDPYLVTERVWEMLRQIRLNGINRISGDLLLDDSHFEIADYDPAAFDREPLRAYNVAPNALLTNFKVVRYHFAPVPESNEVQLRLDPYLENLAVVNRLTTVDGRCRGYQRGITITPNEEFSKITFSGRFPNSCESYSMSRTALAHGDYTYGLFRSVWRESGGEFNGSWRKALAPEDAEPLLTFESAPLSEIITKINKHSNNVMARQVLYTLSAELLGVPGTEEGGREVVQQWLRDRNLYFDEFRLENGAGLSRESRMTARNLGQILRYAYDSPFMPEYLSSLSLSGLDGTLSRRFTDDVLTGKAHIKTGSLDHVAAFAGYFQSRHGNRYIVVTMHNYTNVHRGPGAEVQEALLRWLYEK